MPINSSSDGLPISLLMLCRNLVKTD